MEAQYKESMETNAKSCWNKFSRFADKFSEVIFLCSLVGLGVWSFFQQFLMSKTGFSIVQILYSIQLIFMGGLIYGSIKSQPDLLVYFGFMRSNFNKILFKLYCACLIFPSSSGALELGPTGNKYLSIAYALFLFIVTALQFLKICNKNEELDNLEY